MYTHNLWLVCTIYLRVSIVGGGGEGSDLGFTARNDT